MGSSLPNFHLQRRRATLYLDSHNTCVVLCPRYPMHTSAPLFRAPAAKKRVATSTVFRVCTQKLSSQSRM